MNADAFRHVYAYHFAENRNLWDKHVLSLTQAQFVEPVNYSVGSVCDQLVHMMHVDEAWFSDLRGVQLPEESDPLYGADRQQIRAHWDEVEAMMRGYLADLRDEMLFEKPLHGEDENLSLWQVLLHVVNHGTDHRAQTLRLLHDLGANTVSQDYIFFAYDHP